MNAMSTVAKPPRTPWNQFPDVLIHASETAVKQHRCYEAAKSGDDDAAIDLVLATIDIGKITELEHLAGDAKPTLVSAHAFERAGVNAIPEVLADEIGRLMHWPIDSGIVQANVVFHTGADGISRLARQAEFEGSVQVGCSYVLVDDFVGMGGTLANFKGYIESKGGKVLAAVSLTGKPYSAKLTPSPACLHELRVKHGTKLENWWIEHFAHAFDALTESEARYLTRIETADAIRNRIVAAEQAGNRWPIP